MTLLDFKIASRWVLALIAVPFWIVGAVAGWALKCIVIGLYDGRAIANEVAYPDAGDVCRPEVIQLPAVAGVEDLGASSTTLPRVAGFTIYKHCPCGFPAVSPEDLVHHLDQVHPYMDHVDRSEILNSGEAKA